MKNLFQKLALFISYLFPASAGLQRYSDPLAAGVTTQNSTQYANNIATPPVKNASYDEFAKQRTYYFTHTQVGAGDANSLVNLVKIPAGKYRLLKTESRFVCSAFGAARTLDIGYLAYTKSDGTAVVASIDTILDGADVSAAANLGAGTNALGTDPSMILDSRDGITIQAKVLGDTIPDGATLKGYFTIVAE